MADSGHLEIKRRRIEELEAELSRAYSFIRAQEKTIETLRADLVEERARVK